MYWQTTTGDRITSPTLPAITTGVPKDFTLQFVTETGEELYSAYLFVADPTLAGYVKAKLSSGSEYKEIGQAFDETCSLGYIGPGATTSVDFRVELPVGADGYRIIQILVGYGGGIYW